MNNIENFANAIVDICEYVRPDLSIIDGIEGMEGDGPSSGDKRFVGLIFASENPYALDTVASKIIGIDPLSIPILRVVKERNIFSVDINDIEFVGLKPQDIDIKQFKLPVSANVNFVGGRVPKFMENWILNNFRPRPVFNHNICVSCGICAQNCPPKAIDMSKGKPEVDLKRCIRCFCCHELCPKKAIDIKKHVIHETIFDRK